MLLTPQERLIIELLCAISSKKPSDYDTDFIGKVVSRQQEWAIPLKYESLSDGSPKPLFVSEVFAILDAYRWISDTMEAIKITEADLRAQLADQGRVQIIFDGFDGNNEVEHLSAANVLIDDLGRYQEQKGKANNTHAPRRDAYIRVANAYIQAQTKEQYQLQRTAKNLIAILSEAAKFKIGQVDLSDLWTR